MEAWQGFGVGNYQKDIYNGLFYNPTAYIKSITQQVKQSAHYACQYKNTNARMSGLSLCEG